MYIDNARLKEWLDARIADGEWATARDFLTEAMADSTEADDFRASAEAKMREYDERINQLTADNDRLKSHNYDLLMSGGSDPIEEINDGDGEVEEVVEDDGELYHIDNLFVDDDNEREESED